MNEKMFLCVLLHTWTSAQFIQQIHINVCVCAPEVREVTHTYTHTLSILLPYVGSTNHQNISALI